MSAPDDVQQPVARPDSIAKNAAFSYLTQFTTASCTAVLTIFLVRVLEPTEYGLFAIALSVSAIAGNVADAGISSSAARFVAEADRSPAVGPLIVDSVKLKVLITGSICLLLALLAGPIADAYDEPGLVWPLRAIAIATFGHSLVYMLLMLVTAFGRTAVNLRLAGVESLLEVAASITLVLLGGGAAGAAFGRAIGFVLGALLGAVLVYRLIGRPPLRLRRGPRGSTVRRVGAYASSLLVVDTAYALSAHVNILMLGAFVSSSASGIFHAPWKLIAFLQYVGVSAAYGVAPRLARRAGKEPNVQALALGLRGLIGFHCLLIAPFAVWAGPITGVLLGDAYAGAADVLRVLTPYIFLAGLTPLLSISVNYLGQARRRIPIAVATLALTAGSGLLLIPPHGTVGAAISADIGFGFYTLAHLWLCHSLLRLPLRDLARSLACGLAGAAAMAGVLLAIGTSGLTKIDELAGAVGGTAAFVLVLLLTRELRSQDIMRGAGFVKAKLRPSTSPARDEAQPDS